MPLPEAALILLDMNVSLRLPVGQQKGEVTSLSYLSLSYSLWPDRNDTNHRGRRRYRLRNGLISTSAPKSRSLLCCWKTTLFAFMCSASRSILYNHTIFLRN